MILVQEMKEADDVLTVNNINNVKWRVYNTCCDCLGFLYCVVFQAYKGDYNNILLIKQSEHEIMLTFKHRKKF